MQPPKAPVARTCPEHGHRLVPLGFHPGVFEHAWCPLCDLALVWLGPEGDVGYAATNPCGTARVRRLVGESVCTLGEYRLHRTWLRKGIEMFRAEKGTLWRSCHEGVEVEGVLEFQAVTGHEIKVARCGECRTFNVFLYDPDYGEEILALFPFDAQDLPDIRKLELMPVRTPEIDAATTMAILDQVLRRLLPAPPVKE